MTARADSGAKALAGHFVARFPGEVAEQLESAAIGEAVDFLSTQPVERAAAVLEHLSPTLAAICLPRFAELRWRQLAESLDPGRLTAWLGHLKSEVRERLLAALDEGLRKEIRALLAYPPDSAGTLMKRHFVAVRPETPVNQALRRLRQTGQEPTEYLLITDDSGRVSGVVSAAALVFAKPQQLVGELARTAPITINELAPREDVVGIFTRSRLTHLPVVDNQGLPVGLIHEEGIVKAIQDEALADLQTMVGAGKEERALSTPWFAVRKRLPWLNINLLTAFLAASVVGLFESTIAQFTALAVLLPVVAGQSGNTGAQALAVVMRGLALREIRLRHSIKVLGKELIAAALNGVAIALVTAIGVLIWSQSAGLAAVIGVAMVISMSLAGLAGAAIPMVLTRLGQDPAQSASIILTTVTDVVGFFSFLALATLFSALL